MNISSSKKDVKIEQIAGPYICAEGPHWDEKKNLLYFVDVVGQKIFCYNPETKNITHTYLKNGQVGVAVPILGKNNEFLAGSGTDLVRVFWDTRVDDKGPRIEIISKVDVGVENTRFNDGKVDPKGRLWAGTMGEKNYVPIPDKGSLYRFEYDGTPTKMISPVDISNGLVWSHTNDSFYYIDSFAYNIVVYNYDDTTGGIYNKHTLFDLKKNNIKGIADGMTIDRAGNLWVANHGGGLVFQVDSKTGKMIQSIAMPVSDITSVAFGGPNKDILYVTTAKDKLNETQLQEQPLAGSVFAVYGLGISGSPMLSCKIK
ncbi:regucalcin isoform X3 [Microplitis demolitor]|uniref:regucalcin isoform X3 n=1 Tax=Microplitis demolitor TaxID=69319 RepID=UPI0004CD7F49|nr:regucalcin isoform X3 [Microplitis demolitor]